MHRNYTKYILALVTGVALFAFFYTLHGALWGTVSAQTEIYYDAPIVVEKEKGEPLPFTKPATLVIPSIGVDAKVQRVGLAASGAIGIPTNFTDVAWYKDGPVPGQPGAAIIDGHVDNGLGLPGVFTKLDELKTGDEVKVVDANGTELRFKVTTIKEYNYDQVPTERLFTKTGPSKLLLITCDGKWIKDAKTYDKRLIVTAEYVP